MNPSDVGISIVIPVHNAAHTLRETLDSVMAQTHPRWEALVIDDGSDDDSLAVAAEVERRDRRVRVTSVTRAGAGAARNIGIRMARYDWLLFLDADDALSSRQLERLAALAADGSVDAAGCGWELLASDGSVIQRMEAGKVEDVFHAFARTSFFPIHACLVRRDVAQAVGGFDPSLETCQDWDFWQRVTRTGARFAWAPEVLASYRTRDDSMSTRAGAVLRDGLLVIRRGHSRDRRVSHPDPRYAEGAPREGLAAAQLYLASWVAGLALADGLDPSSLLAELPTARDPEIDPAGVADCLRLGVLRGFSSGPAAWPDLYQACNSEIESFVEGLQRISGASGLGPRVLRPLEAAAVDAARWPFPIVIGRTLGIRIEATEPMPSFEPNGARRLRCRVTLEGEPLGAVDVDVGGDEVTGRDVAAAIAGKHAWHILRAFMQRNLARELPGSFDDAGWHLFLRELWGEPELEEWEFYGPGLDGTGRASEASGCTSGEAGRSLVVEISRPLPGLTADGGTCIVPSVGGLHLDPIALAARSRPVAPAELRTIITRAAGFELCRAAVQQAIVGRPLDARPRSLRARLARLASRITSRRRPAPRRPKPG